MSAGRGYAYGECPNCGEWLEADEADIGVGVQHGPVYCPACGYDSAVEARKRHPELHARLDALERAIDEQEDER